MTVHTLLVSLSDSDVYTLMHRVNKGLSLIRCISDTPSHRRPIVIRKYLLLLLYDECYFKMQMHKSTMRLITKRNGLNLRY